MLVLSSDIYLSLLPTFGFKNEAVVMKPVNVDRLLRRHESAAARD